MSVEEVENKAREFRFWTKQFNDQIHYMQDVVKRFRAEEISMERYMEIILSAGDRLLYISTQRVWVMEEFFDGKKK